MTADDEILFSPKWSPLGFVQDALRMMAQGVPVIELTDLSFLWPNDESPSN